MKRRLCLNGPPLCPVAALATAIVALLAGSLAARAAAPDGQYVREWLVAGPVSANAAVIAKTITELPERVPAPEDGRSFRLPSGQQLTWNRYSAPGSIVNLIHALGQQEHVSGLAYTTIRADREGKARFVVGSNDQLAILLNGRIVYQYDKKRGLSPDEDTFTAPLRAGENACLAIVGQDVGNWGFTLRVLTGEESRPVPLIWDAVDVLEQGCELYSPHWRYCAGDDADFARPDYDDSRWNPLGLALGAAGVKDAAVVWFRCPVWVRPSLVHLPCSMKAGHRGRTDVYADGVRVATMSDATSIVYTPVAPFSFTAAHQMLAVRIERPAEVRGQDSLDLRLTLSTGQADYGYLWLRMHRLIIIATLVLFLVFHVALLYYYPRHRANRDFCLTLAMALVTMLVLNVQEASTQPINSILYWIFLALAEVCMLFGLALVQALWSNRVRRGQLAAWALVAAVLYCAAWMRGERALAQAFAPLVTLEYARVYLVRAMGKVRGWRVYGVGLACFVAGQAVLLLHEFTHLIPHDLIVPYFWVYGFLAFLASISVDIGREFAGAVRKLEDLTATLDGRVRQVTQQLEIKLLAQARLETLRYQLNPHFLYNALNSVEALSREEPAQIPEVVRRLCECLRYALHPKKGGLATLEQELQQVTSYLRVERVRFGEHLAVETDVSDAARSAIVPEFLLQPLVENAVKYGMRTGEMPLRVVIRTGSANGVLEIEVRNTGRWYSDAGRATGGVGLENLKNRLDLLYADRYRLKTAEEAGWVSVTVAIPLHTEIAEGEGGHGPA
jgi:hypothetical protein